MLHLYSPSAIVRRLQAIYASFGTSREVMIFEESALDGVNGANAVLIVETALMGFKRSMAKMPILNICTPPPDMYSMNAFIGSDLAGDIARSQARVRFNLA